MIEPASELCVRNHLEQTQRISALTIDRESVWILCSDTKKGGTAGFPVPYSLRAGIRDRRTGVRVSCQGK